MDAGRELDALIAEKIFGLEIAHREWPCGPDPECGVYEAAISNDEDQGSWFAERGPIYKRFDPTGMEVEPHELGLWCNPVPFYSTDIADAWLVVGRMEDLGYWCEMRTPFMEPHGDDGYWTGFTPHGTSGWNGTPDHWTSSASLPHAICLAALACLEAEAERRTMEIEHETHSSPDRRHDKKPRHPDRNPDHGLAQRDRRRHRRA